MAIENCCTTTINSKYLNANDKNEIINQHTQS